MPKYKILAPWRVLMALSVVVLAAVSSYGQQDEAVFARMKKDITFLASEQCEGRGIDTKGIHIAADYIVNELKKAGLKPGGRDGSWFQPFNFGQGGTTVEGVNTLVLKGPSGQTTELTAADFKVLPMSATGKLTAQVVFVGYGVTVPANAGDAKAKDGGKKGETQEEDLVPFFQQPQKDPKQKFDPKQKIDPKQKFDPKQKGGPKGGDPQPKPSAPIAGGSWVGYDDFKGVDVAGKIVVILRRVPRYENETQPFGGEKEKYAGLNDKIANCELNKAAAVLIVNDRSYGKDGDPFMATQGLRDSQVPVAQLRRGVLDMMMVSAKGNKLVEIEEDIDRDLKPRSGALTGWTGTLQTNVKRSTIVCNNILGVLEGAGPLANETVIVGAHYDHLGYGLGKGAAKGNGKIFPGADDNGSGSTTIMELARRFGAIKNRQGRRIVFMWFSGEERGLLGSKAYCKDPIYPLANTVAMVNLDMVGRLKDEKSPELYAEGFDTGKGMKELLNKLNAEFNFKILGPHPQNIYGRSDQASFYAKKVPGMFFFTDFHNDYHKQGDTANKINVAGMAKVASLAEKIVAHLAETPQRPEYMARTEVPAKKGKGGGQKKDAKKDAGDPKKDAGDAKKGASDAKDPKKADDAKKGDQEPPPFPKLRLQPDYDDETDKGLLVDNVIEDGPADKAGILAGDRIVAINGRPTPNVEAYMEVLIRQKAGVALEVTVDRKGKQFKLKIVPE